MDLRSEQMTNTFDSKAPATLCKEIADVSELEKNLTNSEELEKIIDTRLDAWSQYQKYSLSKLLAANYQCYALEYQKINGNFSIWVKMESSLFLIYPLFCEIFLYLNSTI